MIGNLYAVNTVAVVVGKSEFEVGPGDEQTVEFRHLVEANSLAFACFVAIVEEEKRCKDAFDEVNSISVVSGELLVNGKEVVVDGALDVFTPKEKDD